MSESTPILLKNREQIQEIQRTLKSAADQISLLNMDFIENEFAGVFLNGEITHLDDFVRASINVSKALDFKISILQKLSQ